MLHHYSALLVNENYSHLGCTNTVHHCPGIADIMPEVVTNLAGPLCHREIKKSGRNLQS
jgi:hypothetical protein